MNHAISWDIRTQIVPHGKHIYVSATEPNRLMLYKG
jgi:hypothetical protein